jgi:hypothetical protein
VRTWTSPSGNERQLRLDDVRPSTRAERDRVRLLAADHVLAEEEPEATLAEVLDALGLSHREP